MLDEWRQESSLAASGRRWWRGLELSNAIIGTALEREGPDHVAIRGSGLGRKATRGDGEVLHAVDLVRDRGGVGTGTGLPLPWRSKPLSSALCMGRHACERRSSLIPGSGCVGSMP